MQRNSTDKNQMTLNEALSRFEELIYNQTLSRSAFFSEILEKRAKIDDSCGYPPISSNISIEVYRDLYDRFPIANRVVGLWPKECWQVQPELVETEDKTTTDFEESWQNVCQVLQGQSNYYQDTKGSSMWEYLARADELSGIGTFGIILLGIADGKLLEQPVSGSSPDGNPYIVPDVVSSGMPAGARAIPGAFGSQAAVTSQPYPIGSTGGDTNPRMSPTNLGSQSGQSKSIYGTPRSEENPETSLMDEYASTSRDIYGGATQNPLSSTLGTDAQYRGIQFTPGFYPSGDPYGPINPYDVPGLNKPKPSNGRESSNSGKGSNDSSKGGKKILTSNQLLFMRVFDESLVQVVQYEADLRNPRFGQPIMYLVTLNDPRYPHSGIGLPLATIRVHWSRVIHLADNIKSSEIFGLPRMKPVIERLIDLRKLYGGSAEMYWQGALPGISFETQPQLGGDVIVDTSGMQDMIHKYMEGLERYLQLTGMTAKTLSPTVVDASNQIEKQLEAICIQLSVPVRVFKGSERGELASSQDDAQWNDRIRHRQLTYLTPRVVATTANRLINLGIVAKPKGYSVKWPDLDSQTDAGKVQIAVQKTQAMSAYLSGQVGQLMSPQDYMERILEFDGDAAKSIIDSAQKSYNEQQQKVQQQQLDQQKQQQLQQMDLQQQQQDMYNKQQQQQQQQEDNSSTGNSTSDDNSNDNSNDNSSGGDTGSQGNSNQDSSSQTANTRIVNVTNAGRSKFARFLSGKLIPVSSSWIRTVQYDGENKLLVLTFKDGGGVGYGNVSPREAVDFFDAGSKGGWVWDEIFAGFNKDRTWITTKPQYKFASNVFCPTGEGGGVDPSCSPSDSTSTKPLSS